MTCWPLSRHFSGLGSFFLHLRKATFSAWHLSPMCFDDAVSTADVGIGSPAASTALAISSSDQSLRTPRKKKKRRRKLFKKKKNHSHFVWFPRKRNRRENRVGKWEENKLIFTWPEWVFSQLRKQKWALNERALCVSSVREGRLC